MIVSFMMKRQSIKRYGVLLCLLLISGCGDQELYSSLSEQQANDMVALLFSAGMPASKIRDTGGDFSVSTSKSSFAAAVNMLNANGLPRERYENLGEVFAREGFVSSPLEERARLNHAMSQEIAHTISSIDGVLLARVHLAVPEQNELSEKIQNASASVFIKHRADVDLTDQISKIKALVVNGIENLPYEQVTVALFQADNSPQMPSDNQANIGLPVKQLGLLPWVLKSRFELMIVVGLMLLGILASIFRASWLPSRWLSSKTESGSGRSSNDS